MRMNVALNGVGEPMRRAGESSKGAAGAGAGADANIAGANADVDSAAAAAADGQTSTAELQPEATAPAPIAAGGAEEESAVNGELSWQEQMDRVGRREGCTGYVKINEGDAWYVCTSTCYPSALACLLSVVCVGARAEKHAVEPSKVHFWRSMPFGTD